VTVRRVPELADKDVVTVVERDGRELTDREAGTATELCTESVTDRELETLNDDEDSGKVKQRGNLELDGKGAVTVTARGFSELGDDVITGGSTAELGDDAITGGSTAEEFRELLEASIATIDDELEMIVSGFSSVSVSVEESDWVRTLTFVAFFSVSLMSLRVGKPN
jgi:hypothetical protein